MIGRHANRAREAVGPVVLALLIVTSLATPFVAGLATASTYEKTVTGSPKKVVMDTSGFSPGTFTLEVIVSPAPGGGTDVVYREEKTVANVPDKMVFDNAQAYENVTFRVSGVSSNPDIGPGNEFGQLTWSYSQMFLSTAGDRDYRCGLAERLTTTANPLYQPIDCGYVLPGTTSVNSTNLDANETQLEIYQSAATESNAAENWHTMLNNRLENTETVALTNHGKPAYIKAINNGEGETAASANATKVIEEYYSVIQCNMISRWNSQIATAQDLQMEALNASGVNEYYINASMGTQGPDIRWARIESYGTTTFQLANGTSIEARTVTINVTASMSTGGYYTNKKHTVGPTTGKVSAYIDGSTDSSYKYNLTGIGVKPPTSRYEYSQPVTFEEYETAFASIESQTTSATNQMQTVVNKSWSGLKTGEINTTDLVTPAMLIDNYEPKGEFGSYSAAVLANLGVETPKNFSQIGHMNVSFADGTTDRGIIMARNSPTGGFQVGKTYDPSTISGSIFLVDSADGQIREVSQNFTLTSIRTANGGNQTSFSVEQRNYSTTSADDLKKLYDQIELLQEEINARQQNIGGGAGGGGLLGGGSQGVVLLLVAGAVVTVILSQSGGRR